MTYTPKKFLDTVKPYVLEDMRRSGIVASLTGAQALIESKRGNSELTVKACNLFGIKGTYEGQYVLMWTTEYYNGAAQKVLARFRKYPSWLESINDHSSMFNRLKRYENLRGCFDWKKATILVKQDGYATDPNYTDTLQRVIRVYKLYEWDEEVLNSLAESGKCIYPEPKNTVRYGTTGIQVRWVQWMLVNVGGFQYLDIDGIAGFNTVSAIRQFQKNTGLDPDGICGKATREMFKKMLEKMDKNA